VSGISTRLSPVVKDDARRMLEFGWKQWPQRDLQGRTGITCGESFVQYIGRGRPALDAVWNLLKWIG